MVSRALPSFALDLAVVACDGAEFSPTTADPAPDRPTTPAIESRDSFSLLGE